MAVEDVEGFIGKKKSKPEKVEVGARFNRSAYQVYARAVQSRRLVLNLAPAPAPLERR